MNAAGAALAVLGLLAAPAGEPMPSLLELRAELESREGAPLAGDRAAVLGDQALALAAAAASRSSFWSAMAFVAELCEEAPPAAARALRARALEALAGRFADAMRWSALVTDRFIPRFEKLPRNEWAAELEAYDGILDGLRASATDDRVRAELLYAKARVRVHIDRRWDYLTPGARRETLELLGMLARRFGHLPAPGDDATLLRDRARQHDYELEKLHFGAPAPAIGGTDLEGEPVDPSDFRGRVVVLDFWTSFCQPCLALAPHIREVLGGLDGKPVIYLGINGDTDPEQARRTAQRYEMTWRNLWDGPEGQNGPAFTAWNVAARGLPAVFVLDGRGRIRHKLTGMERIRRDLADAIETLLSELPDDATRLRKDGRPGSPIAGTGAHGRSPAAGAIP